MWLATLALAGAPDLDAVHVSTVLTEADSAVVARFWVAATPDQVEALLSDVPRYPQNLPPISEAEFLAPGVVHLTIDLPWPMSARDSVSRVVRREEGADLVLSWDPVAGPPPEEGVVRLEQSRGYWRLTPQDAGTLVTYESHNTVPANVPATIVRTIHRIEGNRLARNLREAVGESAGALVVQATGQPGQGD